MSDDVATAETTLHDTITAALHPDQKPASDTLLAQIADNHRQIREHQHPERGEDLFCLNLTSWIGERAGWLLKRLADVEAENIRLRTQAAKLPPA